jgi:hypothetical protein
MICVNAFRSLLLLLVAKSIFRYDAALEIGGGKQRDDGKHYAVLPVAREEASIQYSSLIVAVSAYPHVLHTSSRLDLTNPFLGLQ